MEFLSFSFQWVCKLLACNLWWPNRCYSNLSVPNTEKNIGIHFKYSHVCIISKQNFLNALKMVNRANLLGTCQFFDLSCCSWLIWTLLKLFSRPSLNIYPYKNLIFCFKLIHHLLTNCVHPNKVSESIYSCQKIDCLDLFIRRNKIVTFK